jgi:hypothetical protein
MKRSIWGFLTALTLFALGTGTASASIIDFSFKNSGSVADADLCGFNCLLVTTTGTAKETGGLPGANTWSFTGIMKFSATSFFTLEGDGAGTGLGWSFIDTSGNNNLYGSFSSSLFTLLGESTGTVKYSIGGGSGLFAGATGFGASTIDFNDGYFWEKGLMHVVTAANLTSVPEPGVIVLFLTAGGFLALVYQRRRRAVIQH